MNKQSKDGNISWTDYTWNPVKGLCPVGCWYCYGRAIYKRFKMNPGIRYGYGKSERARKLWHILEPGTKIFVCSTFELFHPSTLATLYPVAKGPDITYRDVIFGTIKSNPHLTFQILTKMPENIDRPMPDNVWLGVSIAKQEDMHRGYELIDNANAKIKFISHEPILEPTSLFSSIKCDWVILGRLTGYGKKHDISREYLQNYIYWGKRFSTPIFLKNNLKEIWGEKLIQEFPK